MAQDFAQLPTIHIWHQQVRSVMQQALHQDLSALAPSVPAVASTLHTATRQASHSRAQAQSRSQLSKSSSTVDSAHSGQTMPAFASRLASQGPIADWQQLPDEQNKGAADGLPPLPDVNALPDLRAVWTSRAGIRALPSRARHGSSWSGRAAQTLTAGYSKAVAKSGNSTPEELPE